MQLRRNGAVNHGFQVALDGSKRGAEVVGNVGNKLFLVVLGTGNFACHVVKAGSQITHFVFTFYLKFIMHIAGSILFGSIGNLSQRLVYNLRKENQDNHGQEKQNAHGDVGNCQQAVGRLINGCHGSMDDHIAVYLVIGGNGRNDIEHGFVIIIEKIADVVVRIRGERRVEIFDNHHFIHVERILRGKYHTAGRVNNPDVGV